jgi:MFS family permease
VTTAERAQPIAIAPATRGLFVLFVFTSGTNIVVPLLPLYQEDLGFSNGTFTALYTVYAVCILPGMFLLGTISDRMGRKPVVLPAMLLMAAGTLTYIFGHDSLPLLFLARALHGLAAGAFVGNMTAFIVDLGGDDRRLESARRAALTFTFGLASAQIMSGAVSEITDDSVVVPWVLHLCLLIAAIAVLIGLPETVQERRFEFRRPQIGLPPGTRWFFFLFAAPAGFLLFGLSVLGSAPLPILMRAELDLTSTLSAGLAPGLLLLCSGITQWQSARFHAEPAARWALVLMAAGLMTAALSPYVDSPVLLFLGAGVLGAGYGLGFGAVITLAADAAPADARGSVLSAWYLCAYLGFSTAVIYGYGSLEWGVSDTYLALAGILSFMALLVAGPAYRVAAEGARR